MNQVAKSKKQTYALSNKSILLIKYLEQILDLEEACYRKMNSNKLAPKFAEEFLLKNLKEGRICSFEEGQENKIRSTFLCQLIANTDLHEIIPDKGIVIHNAIIVGGLLPDKWSRY